MDIIILTSALTSLAVGGIGGYFIWKEKQELKEEARIWYNILETLKDDDGTFKF